MNDSKLIELYKTLSLIEKKQFRDYLESPSINSNNDLVKLNTYISNCLEKARLTGKDLLKEEVCKHLFGNKKYIDKNLRYLFTFLMNHLETFISQLKVSKNKILQQEYLMVEFKERGLDKHFIGKSNLYHKELEEQKIHDAVYYYRRYVLEKELDDYFMKKEVRRDNQSLQFMSDNLELFFLSEKLKSLCEMVNRKNIIAATYDLSMSEEIISYVSKNISKFQQMPAINIYYRILMSLLDEKVQEHFIELKKSLDSSHQEFSTEEAKHMYNYAQNYCIKKINGGKQEYLQELFSLYETLLRSELIFDKKHLSQWDYKNIVSLGLKLDKFDWTKKFIEKYKDRIPSESRENAYQYNLASYYYTKKDYKSALKLLQNVEFTDVYYHLNAKAMLLNLYFELESVEPFYSLIDAYKVYLARTKKISAYQNQLHQIRVKYTKQAFDLKLRSATISHTVKEKAIHKLKDRLNANKDKADFSWLMERVNEL